MGDSSQQTSGLAKGVVGSARVTAFGTSIVAPAASVITALVVMVSYAGFASPLIVLITFAGSMCCAFSIAEFARRVPSAGWAYTYNSRGLGPAAGFLTGWMMVFGYAMFIPAGIALASAYASQLIAAEVLHVTIDQLLLFLVILALVVLVAYLGIRTSSAVDLVLVTAEMTVIAALAITILVKIGPAHYPMAVFSPASTPHAQLTDITNAMIYGITAFAGFEAAAALGEEARNTHRSVPASIIGIVIVTGVFYLLVVLAEAWAVGRPGIPGFIAQPSPLGYLTSRYWSPSALWVIDLVILLAALGFVITASNAAIRVLFAMGREQALPRPLARLSGRHTPVVAIALVAVLTMALGLPMTYALGGASTAGYLFAAGGLAVVLVYLTGNLAVIRAFRTEFRAEFKLWRHLIIPATAVVIFLFPLWGIIHPPAYTLVNLLPFAALGWLCLGAIAATILRARQPDSFRTLGKVFMTSEGATSRACSRQLANRSSAHLLVDGKVLTEPIGTALAAGQFARVPVLNGTNHEERIFVSIGLTVSQGTDVPIPETPVTPGNYQANIAAALGVTAARAAQIAAEYPPGNDKASATVAFSALAGDASFACPALRIDQQTSQRVPAYAYEFKRRQRAAELHRAAVPTARGDARIRTPVPVRPAQRALPHPA